MITNQVKEADENEEKLLQLCLIGDEIVVLDIALSSYATAKILKVLSKHHSVLVRHAVACHQSTEKEILADLSIDKEVLVRDMAKVNLRLREGN